MAATPVITARGTVFSTGAAASYATTQTWTPAADSLLVACVVNSLASSPLDPSTFTGHGVTWTQLVLGTRLISTTHTMSVWVAKAGKAPSNAAATAGFGVNQTGCAIIEYEITGADVSGTAAQAIQQNPTGTNTTGTTGTVTYSARTAPANVELSFFAHLANEATTPRANWVEDTTVTSDGNFNTPATGLEGQYRNDGTFETTSTATWTTSIHWLAVGLEIIAALVPANLRNRTFQADKPAARPSASMVDLTIGLTLLASTLAPIKPPFYQTDWPNPLGKASLEISTETRPPSDGVEAFSQTDWPNPQGQPFNLLGRTWTINLQESTLAPAAAVQAPLTQTAWPNPIATAGAIDLRTWIGSGIRTAVAVAVPFHQDDWPTPQSRNAAAVMLRTSLEWRDLVLVDPLPTGRLTEWPTPTPIPALANLRPFTDQPRLVLVDTIYGAPGQVPDYDWPNPQGRPSLRSLQTWTLDLQQATLPLVAAAPFRLSEWPLTVAVVRSIDLRTHVVNLQQGTLGTIVNPFVPGDWPNPRGKDSPIVLRTSTDGRKAYHVDLTPSHLTDWPNPRGIAPSLELRTAFTNLLEYTHGQGTPFAQGDWANPPGKVHPVSLRTWLDWRNRSLIEPLPTARQTEWPTPLIAGRALDLRTWLANLQETTLAQAPAPFGLSDWVTPRGIYVPLQLRTHVAWRALNLVDPIPTGRLQDWPNPRGPKAAEDLRTWLQNLSEGTLAPAPVPFALTAWPTPTGKAYPLSLRTVAQWRQLGLLDLVPAHQVDWPNPQAKGNPHFLRAFVLARQESGTVAEIDPATIILVAADGTIYIAADARIVVVGGSPNVTVRTEIARIDVSPESKIDPEMS